MPKTYFIKKLDADYIVPEETLIDSTSSHSKIEAPVERRIFGLFNIFILIFLGMVLWSAFNMQIVRGDYYASLAELNSYTKYKLPSLRGTIYSSDGKPLAENRPSFNLVILTAQLPPLAIIEGRIAKLAQILKVPAETINEEIEKNKNNAIFVLKRDLTRDEVIDINQEAISGIYPIAVPKRYYGGGQSFSHIVGYLADTNQSDISTGMYELGDKIGRLGIEEWYERYIRGENGTVYFEPNESETIIEEPKAGHDAVTNINFNIQNKLYESMSQVLRSQGLKRGGAVVQDPVTGKVLGMVSFPSYDNNSFQNSGDKESTEYINGVLNDRSRPLFNRVIGGRYSPGSTIKPLLALAGLKEGNITPSTIVYSSGAITIPSEVDPNVIYTFRDWKVHGWTDIYKAIADSVDVYFYALGGGYGSVNGLGIDKISSYISGAGADRKLGVDLPGENTGFVPSRDWKMQTKKDSWYLGDTYNISIGQGDLLVTPLWINSYISAIANGGSIMKPLVLDKIVSKEGGVITENMPEVIGKLDFDNEIINIVKDGMKRSVESGTARLLQNAQVTLAAKTGTAQVGQGELNSLLTVFGPADAPKISITILIEEIGDEQGLALRVAKSFLEWYFMPTPNEDKQLPLNTGN